MNSSPVEPVCSLRNNFSNINNDWTHFSHHAALLCLFCGRVKNVFHTVSLVSVLVLRREKEIGVEEVVVVTVCVLDWEWALGTVSKWWNGSWVFQCPALVVVEVVECSGFLFFRWPLADLICVVLCYCLSLIDHYQTWFVQYCAIVCHTLTTIRPDFCGTVLLFVRHWPLADLICVVLCYCLSLIDHYQTWFVRYCAIVCHTLTTIRPDLCGTVLLFVTDWPLAHLICAVLYYCLSLTDH